MRVYVTRRYQFGDEDGSMRAYGTAEAAMQWLASHYPAHERITWKNPRPGEWWARIGQPFEGNALYVHEIEVQD